LGHSVDYEYRGTEVDRSLRCPFSGAIISGSINGTLLTWSGSAASQMTAAAIASNARDLSSDCCHA